MYKTVNKTRNEVKRNFECCQKVKLIKYIQYLAMYNTDMLHYCVMNSSEEGVVLERPI